MLMPTIFGERLFDNFMDDFGFPSVDRIAASKNTSNLMRTDIKETEDSFELEVELPGYKKEDVKAQLKDETSKVNCFLAASNLERITCPMEEGMEIVATGYISVYERGGYYSLNIRDIEVNGEGQLAVQFEKLKAKLEKEGLFPENYIPRDGAVRFYANSLQRTQATARYFSAGLLPVAVVPVERHMEYNQLDSVFLPLVNFTNDEYAKDVEAELVALSGGGSLDAYRDKLKGAITLLMDTVDMNESEAYKSGKYGDLLTDETRIVLEEGSEPKLTGPIRTAVSVADALVLQYYEEADDLKAAFGHKLTEDDWKSISRILSTYEEILFAAPKLAGNLAHPILKEFYAELNAQGREFSFLCGHDSTITAFLAALGVNDYELPGAIEPTTPIGAKVVFERRENGKGESFFKVQLVYQSVEQLRSIQSLSLDTPPMIVPLSFEGVTVNEDGMIPEKDLMNLFREKINVLDQIVEEYTEEELADAA